MFVSTPPIRQCFLWCISAQITAIAVISGCQAYESTYSANQSNESGRDSSPLDMELSSGIVAHTAMRSGPALGEFDTDDGISCEEGEVLTMLHNPGLKISRAEVDPAMANGESDWSWNEHGIDCKDEEILSRDTGPFDFDSADLLTIPFYSRLDLGAYPDDAGFEGRLRRIVDEEWKTRSLLRRRWTAWAAANADRELMVELIQGLEEIEDIANKLRNMEELNRVDHRLLKIELANRRIQATEIELRVLKTRADLLETMGLPSEAGDLLVPDFPRVDFPEFDDSTVRLIEHNTTLAIEFVAFRSADTSTSAKEARLSAEAILERLLSTLKMQMASYDLATERLDDYRTLVVPLFSDQQEDIRRIAEMGELDMFVLLKTVTRMMDAKRAIIDLQARRLNAGITIEEILGPDLDVFSTSWEDDDNQDDSDTPDTGSTVDGAGQ